MIKHRTRWLSDPDYRAKCASRGGVFEVIGDRGVGPWKPITPFGKPPKPPNIDASLRRLMKATDILRPVKGLDPTDTKYLAKREEAMAAF